MKIFTPLVIALICVAFVAAITTPEGPTSMIGINSSRRLPSPGVSFPVQAGNVTALILHGTTVTQSWAGLYGNVSGTITLDDSANHTLYNWNVVHPQGEVYAAESLVDWSDIRCFNYSYDDLTRFSLAEMEASLGMAPNDPDGVNETFLINRTHRSFYAGGNFIDGSQPLSQGGIACPTVSLYNDTGENSNQFQEVLLYDSTNNKPIYASLLEQSGVIGFNGDRWDFEMIVGVNGHNGSTETKPYYFYVELGS